MQAPVGFVKICPSASSDKQHSIVNVPWVGDKLPAVHRRPSSMRNRKNLARQNNESNQKSIKLSMTVAFEEAQENVGKCKARWLLTSCSNAFEIDFCQTWPWLAGVWWTWAYRVRSNRPLHKMTICAEILSNGFIAIKYDWSAKRLSDYHDYPWQGVWLPSCNIRGRSMVDHILKCADSGVCSCDVVSEVEGKQVKFSFHQIEIQSICVPQHWIVNQTMNWGHMRHFRQVVKTD